MNEAKFDEVDREKVVQAIVDHIGDKLDRLPPPGRKAFRDSKGAVYCVLGGQNWHGIPDTLVRLLGTTEGSKVVIAYKAKTYMEVFWCSASAFLRHASSMNRNERNDLQFNIDVDQNRMRIKEAPLIDLVFLKRIDHPHATKSFKKAMNELSKLSSEEKKKLFEDLS